MKLRRENKSYDYFSNENMISTSLLLTMYNNYYIRSMAFTREWYIRDMYDRNLPVTTVTPTGDLVPICVSCDNLALQIISEKERIHAYRVKGAYRMGQLQRAQNAIRMNKKERAHFKIYLSTRGKYPLYFSLVPLRKALYKIVEDDRKAAITVKETLEKEKRLAKAKLMAYSI